MNTIARRSQVVLRALRRIGRLRLGLLLLLGGGLAAAGLLMGRASDAPALEFTSAVTPVTGTHAPATSAHQVALDACHAPAVTERGRHARLLWTISGPGLDTSLHRTSGCRLVTAVPASGRYRVTAQLAGTDATVTRTVDVLDPYVKTLRDGLNGFLGTLDSIKAANDLAKETPFGGSDAIDQAYSTLFAWTNTVKDEITTLSNKPGETIAALDTQLDDIDNNHDTTSDVAGVPGLKVDLDVDVTPHAVATAYDAVVRLKVTVDKSGPLAFLADHLSIQGQNIGDGLSFGTQATLHIDPAAKNPFTIAVPKAPVGQVTLHAAGSFDGAKNPLAFNVGLLGVTATGSVDANVGVAVTLNDANHDGVIDSRELADPARLFTPSCISTGANAKLDVKGTLAGLGGKDGYAIGHIGLADKNLCDGLSAPDVQLADLDQFRNLTPGDLLNGLAQVTQAIQTAQTSDDLHLPFLTEPLSKLVSFNQDLVKFFVDNGLTDPANPLAKITLDDPRAQAISTLQALAPKLASALGLPAGALNMRFDDGRVLFTVAKASPAGAAKTASIDFGDTLKGSGIAGFTGTAQASVSPSYNLNLGFGFDLKPDTALADRFFLTNGGTGDKPAIFTADADVTADLNLKATLSVLGVTLTTHDSAHPGAVTLLTRKNSATPMLSVRLVDPNNDGRVTLDELSNTVTGQALPFAAAVNAQVPSTVLHATADVIGNPVGAGAVTVAWPDVKDAGSLSVTEDSAFTNVALPFAFDPSDPKALVSNILNATRETIKHIRGAVAAGDTTTSTPLPVIGKSVADLDPVLSKIENSLNDLITTNDALTLSSLQAKVNQLLSSALNVPASATPGSLFSLSYTPRSGSSHAAITARLKLGVCTPGRKDAFGADCTVVTPAVATPFNLQLGKTAAVGGVAGIGTQGDVAIDMDARANLTFGVVLPDVDPGQSAGDLPQVNGEPSLFVQDDSGFEVGLGAKLDGSLTVGLGPIQASIGHGDDHAKAVLATRFALRAPHPTGKRITIPLTGGDGQELTDFLDSLIPHDGITVHETAKGLAATCPNGKTADACASLPVYVGSTSLGTITFTAPNLLDPDTWAVDASDVEAKLEHQDMRFSLIYEGVQTLAEQLQDGLSSLPRGTKIPLLGTDVTAGADILAKFRDKVLPQVQKLATQLDNAVTTGAAKTQAESLLNSVPFLQGKLAIVVQCRNDQDVVGDCTGSETLDHLQSFEVHLPLDFGVTASAPPFDIGFPGLRLASEGSLKGSAGLTMNLAFGLDRSLGFYIPTKAGEQQVALKASATLPRVAGKPDLTGELAFLPIAIENARADDDTPDVSVRAGIALKSPRADGRLPLQDLASAELEPSIVAEPNVDLNATTVKPQVAASGIPTVHTDLKIDGSLTVDGSGHLTNTLGIHFEHVGLDAGSLVTDFIKPAARTLHDFTRPLEKPIAKLREKVPGLADAARIAGKHQYTWLELLQEADKAANGGTQSDGLDFITHVIKLVDLVQAVDNDSSPSGTIDIGSFDVSAAAADNPVPQNDAASLISSSTLDTTNVLADVPNFDGSTALDDSVDDGGLSFPALDHPSMLFQMLLGKDVPLVYFDAGKLSVGGSAQFSYPIGPAQLYIGGSFGVTGHFAAGFDTYGLRKGFQALTDPDSSGIAKGFNVAAGLLQGLYVDDLNQQKVDVPEITITGQLTVGASLGIPGFSVGAEGGIAAHVDFNLHTDDAQDHKLRYPDFIKQFKTNPNPLCLFDISAQVDAFVRVVVDTPVGKSYYPIVSGTPWKEPNLTAFCRTKTDPVHPNLLATLDKNGVLTLKSDDEDQDIEATQIAKGKVELLGDGADETYDGVKSIAGDLKGGNDVVTVHQGLDVNDALPVLLCGGAGDDRLTADTGSAQLYGDGGGKGCATVTPTSSGSDVLQSGDYADTLDGGAKDDSLDSGGGADTLTGQAGADVLRGGTGNDSVDGGAGDDTVDYSDHAAGVTIDLGHTSGSAGEKDTTTTIENVYGSSAADTITLPAAGTLRVDAGAGADHVVLGKSTALVFGGADNDTVDGGEGHAQIVGGDGDDTVVDGSGSQSFLGQAGRDTADYGKASKAVTVTLDGTANDGPAGNATDDIADAEVVIGSAFDDHLTGGNGDQELRGGAGKDHLEGGPGADTLLGGGGNDQLEGGSGKDALDGGADDDSLVGDAGGDDLIGGAGNDTADYSDRTESLTITKDGTSDDGSWSVDGSADNVELDVETIVGGTNRDKIFGSPGADTVLGGPGADDLNGNGGSDRIDGGDGADIISDLTYNRRYTDVDTGDDTFVGGPGADDIMGNGGKDTFDGGPDADVIVAGAGPDTIAGGDGDDQLRGGDGKDVIDGNAGDDSINGGGGDDVLRGDQGSPAHPTSDGRGVIRGGTGNDTIYAESDGGFLYTGDDSGPGGAQLDTGPNTVYGSDAKDDVRGSDGPDTMHLAGGDDYVESGAGNDIVDLGDGVNSADGEAGDDTITGGADKDVVYGNTGNDTLYGGGGPDDLQGGDDNDKIYGQDGNDKPLSGGAGDDFIEGGRGADYLEPGPGTDTASWADHTAGVTVNEDGNDNDGDATDAATPGGTVRDWLRDGFDRLIGGSGADNLSLTSSPSATFDGGPGADTETGGAGNDTFAQGTAANGADDLHGGGGTDTVDYSKRPAGSTYVSLNEKADDGAVGEHDNVHSDVESALGAHGGSAPPPAVSVRAARIVEGKAGVHTVVHVPVALSYAADTPVAVPYSLRAGTAAAGRDYVNATGTVSVPAGATSASVPVTVLGDALDEADETLSVHLGTPVGATVATGSATVTIVDDDAAPAVSIRGGRVTEPARGKRAKLTFTVSLSAASGRTVTVTAATSNGTAHAKADYRALTTRVTFAPGQRTRTIVVTVLGDHVREKTETVRVTLSRAANAALRGSTRGTGHIRNR